MLRLSQRFVRLSLACGGAVALICLLAVAQRSQAQEIAKLYAPRPPAGAAFVRVVNPTAKSVAIRIGNASEASLVATGTIATPYTVVKADKPLPLMIAGQPLKEALHLTPGEFVTVVLQPQGGGWTSQAIRDPLGDGDDLRAELRFYNLTQHCGQASLLIANTAKTQVFGQVGALATARRSINPVEANLVGQCDAAATNIAHLPQLQPADHYSFFLVESDGKAKLVGQADATEAYHP